MHAELVLGQHFVVSRGRVERLMRASGRHGVHRRRLRGCTRRDPKARPCPDLVERSFQPQEPDGVYVADITQHPTAEGWLYLAIVLDCSPAASSAGRWPTTSAANWSSTRYRWPSGNAARKPALSVIVIMAHPRRPGSRGQFSSAFCLVRKSGRTRGRSCQVVLAAPGPDPHLGAVRKLEAWQLPAAACIHAQRVRAARRWRTRPSLTPRRGHGKATCGMLSPCR